jgi:ABC-type lipoprotein export system ATPase subunit
VIQVEGLEFAYGEGDFRLRVPALNVPEGENTAFIGPSGSGKTTLLNLIAGISVPAAGSIRTHGVEVTGLSDSARRSFRISNVGLVFQEFELLEYLTVQDNILLPFRINPSLRLDREVRERAVELASQVGIQDKLSRNPHRLSQGERQRVAVCRALLPQPGLLLADEPTGNLDPLNKDRVLDILFQQVEATGTTLVAVTHDHELLPRFERVVDFKSFEAVPSPTGQDEDARTTGPSEASERLPSGRVARPDQDRGP